MHLWYEVQFQVEACLTRVSVYCGLVHWLTASDFICVWHSATACKMTPKHHTREKRPGRSAWDCYSSGRFDVSKLPAQAGACSFVVNSAVVLHHCDSVFLLMTLLLQSLGLKLSRLPFCNLCHLSNELASFSLFDAQSFHWIAFMLSQIRCSTLKYLMLRCWRMSLSAKFACFSSVWTIVENPLLVSYQCSYWMELIGYF